MITEYGYVVSKRQMKRILREYGKTLVVAQLIKLWIFPNGSLSSRKYWTELIGLFSSRLPILRHGKFVSEEEFYRCVWTENESIINDSIKGIVESYRSKGEIADSSRLNDLDTMFTRMDRFVKGYSKLCCEMHEVGADQELINDLLYDCGFLGSDFHEGNN